MIRLSTKQDLKAMLEIYEEARRKMKEEGNETQWQNNYPEKELLLSDIQNQVSYVIERKKSIVGTFAFIIGDDPTYQEIENGSWKIDTPYGTIHRIAGKSDEKGIVKEALDFCFQKISHIRIDTHENNKRMQHLLAKNGFIKCGIIYVEDGSPRIAYEKEYLMENLELEVKVLDINPEELEEKLKKLGAKKIADTKQYLYTYDLATIYGRFIDIQLQLNHPTSDIKKETALSKLKLLFFDVDNLLSSQDKKELKKIVGEENLEVLLCQKNLLELINKKELDDFFFRFHNNDNKWIRVRKTNEKITIAVKHILADDNTKLQQMKETEIEVSSMEGANQLLEALGFSYKSYQEKRRITYELEDHEIDIDTWPGIPTYFEVEGKSLEDLKHILGVLGYSLEDSVSCTANQVYEMYGKSQFEKREMKFDEE